MLNIISVVAFGIALSIILLVLEKKTHAEQGWLERLGASPEPKPSQAIGKGNSG